MPTTRPVARPASLRAAFFNLSLGLILFASLAFTPAALAQVKVGDRPPIDWKTTEGQSVTNADMKGRIIVIDFWATWCGPCMAEADHMVKLRKQYADRNVSLLGVSLDSNAGHMKQVAAEKNFDWPQVCDTLGWNGAIPRAWGVRSIPQTFILSGEGEVLWAGHPAQLDAALEKAAASQKPPEDPRKETFKAIEEAGLKLADKDYASLAAALGKLPDAAWKDSETRLALRSLVVKALRPGEGAEKFRAAARKEPGLEARIDALAPGSSGSLGSSAATRPATRPSDSADKSSQARLQLAKADKAREAGEHVQAYALYRKLAKSYASEPEAAAAAEQAAKYEADTAVMQAVKDDEAARAARSQLALAKGYRDGGKLDLARQAYQSVIKDHPGTPAAKEAQAALAEMK